MWTPQYDIIVETLTGSEFEVTVTGKDTIGYIKSRIQKYEGIPVGQQHLLYNQKELTDSTELRDIPLVNGSRLKLVLDMKGGPVSARRVVNLPDCENWFDLSDVFNTSRHDPLTITTPGVKLLFYKDYKKNFHRIMKLRSDRKLNGGSKSSDSSSNVIADSQDEQWVKDNIQTLEKMHNLRIKLEEKKRSRESKEKDDDLKSEEKIEFETDQKHDKLLGLETDLMHTTTGVKKEIKIKSDNINAAAFIEKLDLNVSPPTGVTAESAESLSNNYIGSFKKSSGGILKKYGLNKTCIRPMSMVQPKQKRSDSCFQLQSLSLSLPSPSSLTSVNQTVAGSSGGNNLISSNSASNSQNVTESDLPAKFQPSNPVNAIKSELINYWNLPKNEQIVESSDSMRSSLRESFRRNRSLRAIERNANQCDDTPKKHQLIADDRAYSLYFDYLVNGSIKNSNHDLNQDMTSKSIHDLTEKINSSSQVLENFSSYTGSKLKSASPNVNKSLKNIVDAEIENGLKLPKCSSYINSSSSHNGAGGNRREDKTLLDKQKTLSINSLDTTACSSNLKLETATATTTKSALDTPFRLYSMSSEVKMNFELPKLLIREDSPVESFHLSDPQFETLTIRGDSPKTVIESFSKMTTDTTPRNDILDESVNEEKTDLSRNKSTILKSPWSNHHNSDLGLNNLEFNLFNERYSDIVEAEMTAAASTDDFIKNGSVLKIASNLEINNTWNNSLELDNKSQPSTTSLNFINSDLISSDDDLSNDGSCCISHSNAKSKSVELNDFRMMFGSSPTLLNSNYNSSTANYNSSRLDAVPIQYRRGYTNLNDACLSSSTSDLELFNAVRKKNSSKSASQELPSTFSRHHHHHHHSNRTNESLDFIRSYENLDRTKITRLKSERTRRNLLRGRDINKSGIGGSSDHGSMLSSIDDTKSFWEISKQQSQSSIQSNFSNEALQKEDDFCGTILDGDDYSPSYSQLGYENLIGSVTNIANDQIPEIDFPIDEDLFNINLEKFATDSFNLLSSPILRNNPILTNSTATTATTSTSVTRNSSTTLLANSSIKNSEHSSNRISSNNSNMDLILDTSSSSSSSSSTALVTSIKTPQKLFLEEFFQKDKDLLLKEDGMEKKQHQQLENQLNLNRNENNEKYLQNTENCNEKSKMKPSPSSLHTEKQRCAKCNKKLGVIMIMKCHCEKVFCPQHRYAESHNCSYNFKLEGKKIIAKENPLVIAQKVTKI